MTELMTLTKPSRLPLRTYLRKLYPMIGTQANINHFFITGINYKKTDTSIRGQFAINPEQYNALLETATGLDIKELFVLSTCNRTEIFGIASHPDQLMQLLCTQTAGDIDTFRTLSYTKSGLEAVEHLFTVAAGIDSQILGDYEIVGQLKQAVRIAKEKGMIGAFIERLFNTVLQSSKQIKNETALSGGTVSVSFAAIQFLKETVTNIADKKIVLVGTGKIGRNTCKNLVDYLDTRNVTLVNRTEAKAAVLAEELQIQSAPYSQLDQELEAADIIIVSTNAEEAIIKRNDLVNSKPKVLIDLSIPNNVEASAKTLPHIILANVDDLSRINDVTLQKRLAEVPKAKEIIATHIDEFIDWYEMRSNVPVLRAVKEKLMEIHQCEFFNTTYTETNTLPPHSEAAIQKVVTNMAVKLRQNNTRGCHYIEAINDYIAVGSNS